ncbi:NADPH2:quinone reductase [Streptoalloteichus tenebrarius]|uniref:NADPH2:quinone reductase n=1 Tax=Streptoalloteichus tenebrarius (strain ATCC 17920 / DSM 40477 / JCM 4838 / CBS 697.72 / NBRC 16177 / NCIMB 11028 / NRRL B-12390 / A12253. 1 / ISP 5477) TaxID=1933 RepID=A0ABT1HUL8_STRSD|nr:zinc-binding alcohol dehydrogenase family protein [Streptoalloteichus tenebrarius]MCP2259193.1 NADPH2:quinone reductase [Streptoalloteichus tenebrarius]BFF04326.1 zinc-binding alcohol dehydrogenase family protein [Streptoalloteichus tenebrarius]
MRAIAFSRHGGYDELRLVERPTPRIRDGQALVRVAYAEVSPADDTIRAGRMSPSLHQAPPLVPGGGGVGVVVDPGTTGLAEGGRVVVGGGGLGWTTDGTWREHLAADAAQLLPVPDGVSDEAACALFAGAGFSTAYLVLTHLLDFRPGLSVLAPGVGGAVGMGTTQVARELGASMAISTASGTDKAERARAAGYEHVIDLSRESVEDGVARLTDGRGVDVVIDGVAGPLLGPAIASLAHGGSYVSVGYSGGREGSVNVTDLIWKNAKVYGYTFTMIPPRVTRAARVTLLEWLSQGRIDPVIARIFPLDQAARAQRHLVEDRPFGRVLLAIAP